ncbi:MAG TPA: helix-turn-helix transcriptional regulator [Bacteroidales bacterium]|nr:helix-turn-helix transcriptional regulator [Bacteroidales bacterium]
MEARKIYNRVNVLRKDLGMTRKQFASRLGISYQTAGYLEREMYNPSLDLAFRVSELFELPVEMIFSVVPMPAITRQYLQKLMSLKDAQNGSDTRAI